MNIAYRFISLIVLAALALPLLGLTINLLIKTDALPSAELSANVGTEITTNATYVWLVSLVPGTASLFINHSVRKYLMALPLVAPSLYAVIYSMGL